MLLLVPAPVQVCAPGELGYFPQNINLADSARFDMELPQRTARSIAEPLGFHIVDLQPVLQRMTGGCPYQTWNMHWTREAHRRVAESLSATLIAQIAQPGLAMKDTGR